jgi:nitrite reductase/ring-hydroxylating ferredoxin subunit
MADNIVRVCAKAEIAPESVKAFDVGDKRLAVFNIGGRYYVTDDECTHASASLADGMLDGDVIECSFHFGAFHVPSGKAVQAPCFTDLKTFRTEVRDGQVCVDLSTPAGTAS